MTISSLYPLVLVEDVDTAARFYEQHFGFTRVFDSDWYVHLRSPAQSVYELALIVFDHETIPAAGRAPTTNLILSFEVDDAAADHERLVAAGVTIAQPLRDEVFGQRHFIATDPNGIMLDVITPIEPDPEWLKANS
jgi:uncharacterized glyoxalase superfamily protein PhnB